jgi:hypothetical protein
VRPSEIRVLGQWSLDSSVFSTLGSGETHPGVDV